MTEETGLFAPGLSAEEAPRPSIMGGKKRRTPTPASGRDGQAATDAPASSPPAPPLLGAGGATLEQGGASGPEGESGGEEEVKPIKQKLQLANGYSVNFDQLAQLLHTVSRDSRRKVPIAELAESIGLSTMQMKYLSGISVALGLVLPMTMRLTPIGALIVAQDQFFDDTGTLWFLHYIIGSNRQLLVWNRFVNDFLPARPSFTIEQLRDSFDDLKLTHSAYSARAHVSKEINTILDAYTNQQFSRLAYLRQTDSGYMPGFRQPVPLPVLAASVTRFRDRHQPTHTAVSVRDLLSAPNSPGVVFALHEDTLRAGLEQLRHGHGFSLETRGDLDQLRFAEDIPAVVRMERYYAGR